MHGVIFLNLKSYTEHSLKKDWRDLLEVAAGGRDAAVGED
jgi:hypothetical protein